MSFQLKLILSSATLIFAASGFSAESSSISGRVIDPQGRGVPQASIALFSIPGSSQRSTQADSSGSYRFVELGAGRYLLEVRARGFSTYRVNDVQLETGQNVSLNVPVSVETVQQQVSVTAASTPQTGDQIAKALSIIDNNAIQQRQDYLLLDAIRFTPGVRVEQEGGPGSFSEILVRGLRPEDTSILVDGMRLRDASGTQADASSLLQDFLLPDVSRIEILRGSGSSLYGTNAIGGVVNVITDQGGGPTHGSIELEAGSLGLFRGSALLAGGTKNDRFQYSAGLMDLNVSNGVGGYNPARIWSLQSRVAYRLAPTVQLIARFFGSTSFSKVNTDPQAIADFPNGIVPAQPLSGPALHQFDAGASLSLIDVGSATYVPSVNDPDSSEDERFETGALTLVGQPSSKFGYTVDYQINNSSRRYGNGPAGPGFQPDDNTRSDYNGRIQTVSARVNYEPGRFSLFTAGYEFENENYNSYSSDNSSTSDTTFVNVTQTSHTAFLQDQARFFDNRLYISAGFRAQFFEAQQPQFVPAAQAPYQALQSAALPAAYTGDGSIAYHFAKSQTKIRAHVGRGYRAPSLYERFGAGYDSFFGYSVYGDPDLRPEQSIAVDAGVDQSLFNNKLRLSATYFYTHLQRVIFFDTSGLINPLTDPFGRSFGYLNTHGGFARGLEFNASWAFRSTLTISGSYTYTDAREETPLVPSIFRSFNTPQNQFTGFLVQRLGKNAFVDFDLNAADNYLGQLYSNFSSGAYLFPGYKRGDVGFSYRIPFADSQGIRLFAKVENIFDRIYYEQGFLTPGVTARAGLQFEF